jgi:hypothetical protein
MWVFRASLIISATKCRVVLGFGLEGTTVNVKEEVLVTMKIVDCRMYEVCDKLDETTRVLRTTHDRDWVLLGQHGTSIAGDRVATSIR